MEIQRKREKEKRLVSEMIAMYCHHNHGTEKGVMCPSCAELDEYAKSRSEKCPFMGKKTFCSSCKVHCYSPDMREKIRQVMRYSGPRIFFYHPVTVVRHVLDSRKNSGH